MKWKKKCFPPNISEVLEITSISVLNNIDKNIVQHCGYYSNSNLNVKKKINLKEILKLLKKYLKINNNISMLFVLAIYCYFYEIIKFMIHKQFKFYIHKIQIFIRNIKFVQKYYMCLSPVLFTLINYYGCLNCGNIRLIE